MTRAAVVGTSGSGKTAFAAALARRRRCPHVELDALYWEPNWRRAALDSFRARVDEATKSDSWVADGSYFEVRDLVWGRADTLVWLDYPLPLVLARLLRRTVTRLVTREQLWGGSRERLREHFGRDSLFLGTIRQHRRDRQRFPEALADPVCAHLRVHRFRRPSEAARWLAAMCERS